MSKAMKKRIRSEEDEVDNKADAEFDDSEDESEVSKSGNSDDDDDKEVKESASLEPLIKQLRSSYGSINKIDPEGPAYKRLIAILDKADVSTLKALVSADIKFVSVLARNRLTRKGVKESVSKESAKKVDQLIAKHGFVIAKDKAGWFHLKAKDKDVKKNPFDKIKMPPSRVIGPWRSIEQLVQAVEKRGDSMFNESVMNEGKNPVDLVVKIGNKFYRRTGSDKEFASYYAFSGSNNKWVALSKHTDKAKIAKIDKQIEDGVNESVIAEGRISVGSRVKVAHKGKMVSGKVVRFSKPDDFYVVDVGDAESIKVPAHKLEGARNYSESVMEAKKPQRFDTVRVKSMNTTGMVYSVTGSKAEIRTPTKLITVDVKDLEVVQMDEAKSDYTLYHKTYSDAVQHAVQVAKKRGFEVDEDDFFNKVTTGPKKPSSGKTNSVSIELTKSGKPVKQKLNMQVYNMDNRSYELNMYIESTQVPPTAKGEDEPKEEDEPKSPYVDNPSDKRIGSDSILKYHQMKKKIMDRPDAEKQDGSDEVVPAKKPSKTFESFCSELTTESTYEVDIDGYGHTTVKASTEKQAMNLGLAKLHVSPAARKGFNKSKIKVRLKESMKGEIAGWIAFYNGKKLEITKNEADGISNAKQLAIKHFNVPKSKQGLLAIKPAYDESYKS